MADIKQAAKWMRGGKKVTRHDCGWADGYIFMKWNGLLKLSDGKGTDFGDDVISVNDLLADDWGIVNE